MIIIPELETILLQPPRTGTSSVKDAVLKCYPQSFLLYRHMEYAGIPVGYERWKVIAQVRNPYERMISLFSYMAEPEVRADTDPAWLQALTDDTRYGFDIWLTRGTYVFANPAASDFKAFRPKYNCAYPIVEQRKSQSLYAERADELIRFEQIGEDIENHLDIPREALKRRGTSKSIEIEFSRQAKDHMAKWHGWDLNLYYGGFYG